MAVAGAAASLGVTLANDRRLTPVMVEASTLTPSVTAVPAPPAPLFSWASVREFLARRIMSALAIGAAGIILMTSIPAVTAFASSMREAPESYGPPAELRAAAGIAGGWEESSALAAPPTQQLGNAVVAGAVDLRQAEFERALVELAAKQAAAVPTVAPARVAAAPARTYSLNAASGLAVGTLLRARITIYGCQGPGGGFCHTMSCGGAPFAGAVACSDNLPFGTKLRIIGDPTGRTYECLDRGRLSPTWIDVYFENTADGMAWQSSLGTTLADIEIVN
jgi:hypothetical protein